MEDKKSENDIETPEVPEVEAAAAAKAAAIEGKDGEMSQDLENEDKSSEFNGEEREWEDEYKRSRMNDEWMITQDTDESLNN